MILHKLFYLSLLFGMFASPTLFAQIQWPKLMIHLHSSGHAYLLDPSSDSIVADLETVQGGALGSTTPDGRRVYIGGSAVGQREVVVLDLALKTVTNRIETGNRPKHPLVSPNGQWVGINHWGLDNGKLRVSFIKIPDHQVTQQIELEVSQANLKVFASMHNAWSWDSQYFFTLDRISKKLVVIDIQDWSIRQCEVESAPHYVVPSQDGKEVWLVLEGNEENRPKVIIYDLTRPTLPVIAQLDIPLIGEEVVQAHHGNFTQDGKYFLVTNRGPDKDPRGREVAIFSAKFKTLVHRITTASNGIGHTYNTPDGKYAVVTNYGNNVLSIIDISALKVVKDLVIGTGRMGHIAFTQDSRYGYVSNHQDGVLYKLDMQNLKVVKKINVNAQPGVGQILNVWTNVFEELPQE